MDGNAYFIQQVNNNMIPYYLIAMAAAQERGDDEAMLNILRQMVAKAFNDGKNDELEVQYKAGNALHR